MNAKEKACRGAATPEQAIETRAPRHDTHISQTDYNTFSPKNQYLIEKLLKQGKENVISTERLLELSGAKNIRQLQKQISVERENGALILSSSVGGYFLPDKGEKGRQEIAEYVRTLQARALNTLKILKAVKASLNICDGQESLEDFTV